MSKMSSYKIDTVVEIPVLSKTVSNISLDRYLFKTPQAFPMYR